jgi:predicted dinucleotide-binding enzyme
VKVGIVGSGSVARDLGRGFVKRGDHVKLGSRSPERLADWVEEVGDGASAGTMEEAAAHGEVLVIAVKGTETDSAIEAAGRDNFAGKVLIDPTNPIVFDADRRPDHLAYGPTDSGGERLQRALPDTMVVKSLGIVNSGQMVDPEVEGGPATMFVAGNDGAAKETVTRILADFGWQDVADLGGIEASRELESLCMLWCRYALPNQAWLTAFKLLR